MSFLSPDSRTARSISASGKSENMVMLLRMVLLNTNTFCWMMDTRSYREDAEMPLSSAPS